ncbi:MAG: hypothetical protein ACLFTK_13820 [Anaerolineales bacterium]
MDVMQTARMIEWLDEERRRDKNMIAQLEERTHQQQEQIEQLRNYINGLENQLSSQRSQYMPANREDELIERMRREFNEIIEGLEAKRLTAERETERRAEQARENMLAPMRDLEERIDKTENNVREVLGLRTERERMASALAAIQQRIEDVAKKIEEPERRIVLLEEQRRQDSRRLSELQTEIPDINKALDNLGTKADLIEGLTKSNEKRIIDIQMGEASRREEIQQFLDEQNLTSQQRDQQINELRNRVTAYDDDMRRNLERFEAWAETHRQMRKVVDDFERIGERLERRINEVAEMQRLSEERFRTEWNDWIADDQLRWKEFNVSNDESWRTNAKAMGELRDELRQLGDQLSPLRQSLERLWNLQRAQAELYRERYQTLLHEYDKPHARATSSNGGTENGTAEH